MITIVTNTTSVIELVAYPFTTMVTRRGAAIETLAIPCSPDMTLESVKETFSEEASTVAMILMEDGEEVRRYADYIKMEEISWIPDDVDDEGKPVPGYYLVKLSQKLTFDAELLDVKQAMGELRRTAEAAAEAKKEQDERIETLKQDNDDNSKAIKDIQDSMSGIDPDTLDLPALKEYLIGMSKMNLADYLESNPISSAVHGGMVKKYSITAEKQSYLMAMILMSTNMEEARLAGMKQYYEAQYGETEETMTFEEFVVGVDAGTVTTPGVTFNKYQPSWNAVGEPCSYDWTINELKQLAAEIEAVVRPLVSKQQTMEVEIKAATTIEGAKDINLSFTPATKMRH